MAAERVHKLMARAGVASRRKCEQLILDGRVKVNGEKIDHLGAKAVAENDSVEVDGRVLQLSEPRVYLLLNKPRGYVTTASDERGRPTVLDLVGDRYPRLFPVGRLDMDTEGLLLLTNDGDLAFRLTHPRFKVMKSYVAEVEGRPEEARLSRLRAGIVLEDGRTQPATVDVVEEKPGRTRIMISISEGRKRQVRRMFARIGHPVRKLRRLAFGPVRLGNMSAGQYRELSMTEVSKLMLAGRLKSEGRGSAGKGTPGR